MAASADKMPISAQARPEDGYENANRIGRESEMEARSFSYYMHDGPTGFSIELAGTLAAEGAKRVEHDWPGDVAAAGKRQFAVDLASLTQIDPAERRLLRNWLRNVPNIDFDQPVRLALWSQNGGYRVYSNEGISDRRYHQQEMDETRVSDRRGAEPIGNS